MTERKEHYLIRALLFIVLGLMLFLSGCTLMCRVNCRQVDYVTPPCKPQPCGAKLTPCPCVRYPGFYEPDFGCIGNMSRLTYIRNHGIGVIILGDRLRFILPTDVIFTRDVMDYRGKIEVSDCAISAIADIGEVLKCIPCVPIMITGHTDEMGTQCQRFRRSREMAQAVAAQLWAQGVPWCRMCVKGRANCDPISSDMSVFGSSDNRRVEIRLDFSRNDLYNCRYNNCYCPDCLGDRIGRF